MKNLRTPLILLLALYIAFLAVWAWSGTQLPPRVATHFNAAGVPDGWMTRTTHQYFMLAFGFGFPLFMALLFYVTRFLPSWAINIPDRQYWLAPERRQQTFDYLLRHGLWLACLEIPFVAAIQYSIVQANRQSPPHLPTQSFLLTLIPFALGVIIWLILLLRHFRRRPA